MSRSPEEKRQLIARLRAAAEAQKFKGPFPTCPDGESASAIEFNVLYPVGVSPLVYADIPAPLFPERNWPSETTLNTNRLNDRPVTSFSFSNNSPAARRSPARLKEAVSWWFARAEARRIIERMMQP